MYNSATILPAYGRDYKSKAAVLADWQQGKDFQVIMPLSEPQHIGAYLSIRDLEALKQYGITHLHFRYNRQTQIHVVKL